MAELQNKEGGGQREKRKKERRKERLRKGEREGQGESLVFHHLFHSLNGLGQDESRSKELHVNLPH